MIPIPRATHALIHLDNLRENLRLIRQILPSKTLICAAVKANAYGHDIRQIARTLRKAGVAALGVANPLEGAQLREDGDRGRILLFAPTLPQECSLIVEAELEPFIGDHAYLKVLEKAVPKFSSPLSVHLKVDTGMGRFGCQAEEALALAQTLAQSPFLQQVGLATHFPCADSSEESDRVFTQRQINVLKNIALTLEENGLDPGVLHAANSGAIASYPESSLDMVRLGLALYGYGSLPLSEGKLQPVMEVRTCVTALRLIKKGAPVSYRRTWRASQDSWIATLPIGYADGYSRFLSNKAEVLIRQRRYPIVGQICMDQLMVNLGTAEGVNLYDEATIFGPSSNAPRADELADLIDTIPYEIICGISERVPRIFIDTQQEKDASKAI